MDKLRENKRKNFKNIDKVYIIYTLLFSIISILVFLAFIIYNKSFVWEGDGIKQHFVILYDFNQIIRNIFKEGIPMLSWNIGLGLDVIGQYSYYVIGDPFAYISLLFPMDKLEIAYNFLVILRMYCVGLAFIAYCRYTGKKRFNTILGAIIYTFCGFILYAGVRHPYFTNAAIFLPLTLIGIEKLLKENKKVFLIFIIFMSLISNYYFFYMITIISFIYGIIKYIFEYNQGIKEFFKRFGNAILCYIIGILMASLILLPTIYTFLNSARTESQQIITYTSGYYEFLFMGIVSMRFKNWTIIALSSIVILMLSVLFSKSRENKETKSCFVLFLVTTIMLLIPQAASMMNGFSFPSNRWVFAYSFILAYIVAICFDNNFRYSKEQKISMFIILVIYSIIGAWVTKLKIKQNLDYYAVGVIAYLIFIVISYKYKSNISKKIANYIVLFLVIVNIFVLSSSLYFPKGKGYVKEFIESGTVEENCSNVNRKIENFDEAIKYIKENDKEFYRIAKKDISYQNLSIIYDYNPIQLFLSLGNQSVYNLSCYLDDNCYTSTRCVNGADRRTKYTTLLGNKYYICDIKDSRYVPYGYNLYHEIGNTQIYINQNYLTIGIVYDSYIYKEQFEQLSALEKEDSLITTAMIENNEDNIEIKNNRIKIDTPSKLQYTVKDDRIINNTINISKKNETIELSIENIPENCEIYLSIKNLKYISDNNNTSFKIKAKLDGIFNSEEVQDYISSAYYMDNPDFLMNLGITKEDQDNHLQITFSKKGRYTFDDLEILVVDMNKYENKIDKLKTSVMEYIEYGNDYILGTVDVSDKGILQITTSYSDGWKVYIDGEEQEVIKVNEAFIGTVIEEGNHIVEFRYETPYLKLGIIFSIVGIFGYIFIILKSKNRNKDK